MKICDNPKCRFYIDTPSFHINNDVALYIESYLEENEKTTFQEKTIKRHKYRFSTTPTLSFYLCEICHNAVKMTK